jgi:hypothetical protein
MNILESLAALIELEKKVEALAHIIGEEIANEKDKRLRKKKWAAYKARDFAAMRALMFDE